MDRQREKPSTRLSVPGAEGNGERFFSLPLGSALKRRRAGAVKAAKRRREALTAPSTAVAFPAEGETRVAPATSSE